MFFCPNGGTQTVTANNSGTSRLSLSGIDPTCGAIRVFNPSTSAITGVTFGTGSVDGVATDCPIAPLASEVLLVPSGADEVAFNSSGSQTISVTIGQVR